MFEQVIQSSLCNLANDFFSWPLALAVFQDEQWNCITKNNLIQCILPERINQASLQMMGKILKWFFFYLPRKPLIAPEVLSGTSPCISSPLVAALLTEK